MPSFILIQSPQPNISTFKKTLMIVDYFQQKFAKISYLSPELLLTENRKDVEYRINFLEDVLEHKIPIEKTLYYQFIADDEKNVIEGIMMAKKKKAITIGLLGNNGGKIGEIVDIPIIVNSEITSKIQEVHRIVYHIICELLENELVKKEKS